MNNCDTQSENCSSSTVGGWWSSSHKLDSWVYVPVKYIARIASWQLFLQRCKFCCSSYSCKPLTDILPLLSGPIAYNIHFSHWSTVSFLLIFTNVEIFLFTNAEIVHWQSAFLFLIGPADNSFLIPLLAWTLNLLLIIVLHIIGCQCWWIDNYSS